MNSSSTHFVTSRRMGIYEPLHQISTWGESFKTNGCPNTSASTIAELEAKLDNQSEDTSHGTPGPSDKYDQEATKPVDKVQRRLAQNREAARKSRLRKKAYVQELESSRVKLMQLEQELERARQQGLYIGGGLDAGHLGFSGAVNSAHTKNSAGIAAFEMEYGHWVEEQSSQICELRTALHAHISDVELRILVETAMNHYFNLFRMKANAAKADVFYMMSGMWKTSAERFFLWIGGFRPSELLKVLVPQLDPLTDQQILDVCNLRQSCQQAEDALTQGMEKLQQILAEAVAAGQLGEGSYIPQLATALEKLEAVVSFVNQFRLSRGGFFAFCFCGPSSSGNSAADGTHPNSPSSSSGPACPGGVLPASSSLEFTLGYPSSVCSMMVVYFPMKCLGNEGIPILEQPSANKIFIGSWSDGDVHGCFPSFKFREHSSESQDSSKDEILPMQ
ncbi:Transcription factor TGA1 [Vitis vinifera]|uniref:Transcription factor TGA1 n=1 Tax=Vitis vinifera TaxID=29760 RepID=A0A438KJ81_VITVI|nr:Transcription factor TGA1 [Vitis vinifera]